MIKTISMGIAIIATVWASSVTAQVGLTTSTTSGSLADISCINKGNFVIGSRIGMSANKSTISIEGNTTGSAKSGTQKSTQLNITPSLSYFFADRFLVGIGMDFLKTTSSGDNSNATSNSNSSDSRLLFGPQLRYYLPINSSQSFFLGAVSGFGTSNTNIVVDGKTQNVSTHIKSIGFGPGYTIFSNNCIAMETQAKYNFGSTDSSVDITGINQTTNSKTNAFDFVVSVSYYFGR